MKNQLTLFAIAVIFSFSACKKKSGSDEPEATPVKLLSRIIEVSGYPTPSTKFSIFTYDDKKRISTIKTGKATRTYSYHGDELFSIEYKDDKIKNLQEFTYENGRPIKVAYKDFENGSLKRQTTRGFIYTGDKVTEAHLNDAGTVAQKNFYRYLGENMTGNDTQSDVFISKDLVYGTKKSAYYNSRLKYNVGIGTDMFSANDLLSSIIKYPNGAELRQENTFTYDNDDFPVTLLTEYTFETGSTAGTYKFTFEYQMY